MAGPKPLRLASLAAGADRLAVAPKTVRRMIARGELTGYRIGSRDVKVDLIEIDALIASSKITTADRKSA